MNAAMIAQAAYAKEKAPIRTLRGTEFDAFAHITRLMKAASDKGADGFPQLAQALHKNRQLWTILAADVSTATNALPDDLRARIFYLSEFTAAHTRQVLRGSASAESLIDINIAVMRGLRSQERE